MSPLSGVGIVLVLRIEHPTRGQLSLAPIPCRQHGSAVVAAAHHNAWAHAIEIRDACEEAVGAIADGVVAAVAADTAPSSEVAARWNVVGGRKRGAGASV